MKNSSTENKLDQSPRLAQRMRNEPSAEGDGDNGFLHALILVAIGSAMLDSACIAVAHFYPEFEIVALAMLVGQTAVAGIWLGMGKTAGPIRLLAAWVAGCIAFPFALIGQRYDNYGPLIGMMLIVASALISPVLRFAGARVVRFRPEELRGGVIESANWQFSLRQVFGFTTVAAIVMGLIRYSANVDTHILSGILILLMFLVLALFAAWAELSQFKLARFLAIAVTPAISLVPIVQSWFRTYIEVVAIAAVAQSTVVMLTLLPFRRLGYRVRFRADRSGNYS